jgi:hypothetical protein
MRNVFGIPLQTSVPISYVFILFSLFAVLDSLCFAGAAFVLTEYWLHINFGMLLSFPSDLRPSIVALLVCAFALIFHIQFYRFTLYKHIKKMQEIR